MSRLDELIAELCPNGVEYIPLGEVLKNNNAPNSISKKYYKENGDIPIIDQSQVYIAGYTDDESAVPPILPCIIFGDHTRVVKYADRKFAQGDSGTKVFIPVTEDLNTKYIYYAFCNIDIPSRGYNRHWTIAKNIKIPIPPLPVQQEIVRILDNFTELIAELTAELTARKKQYEYYRDLLLTFGDEVEWCNLEEILKIRNGKDYKSFNVGNIPVYGSGGIMTYIDTYVYDKPSVLIPRKGSIDKLYYVEKPFWTVDTIFYTEIYTSKVIPKYVFYCLQKERLEQYNTAGGVPSLTQTVLNKVKIPVPPLEEQERIVAILDRFDALCNDLTSGIPAEIEARQKQYEYYRDKLLSFKEVTG